MAKEKQNAKIGKQNKIYTDLVEKPISLIRQDISKWRLARTSALNPEFPSRWRLQNLYENDIIQDALLSSQIDNRKLATLGAGFLLRNAKGDTDEGLTDEFQNSAIFNDIIEAILDTRFFGHSLVELDYAGDQLRVNLIPRQNVLPVQGWFRPDYTEENRQINYRELPEYGTWLLEFGKPKDLGLLNKAVPHVLFKKFAQSCWSELCEIYGIPPRVYKTDTNDPRALARGKKMMTDMGAAAWFIIDTMEEFEWAKGVDTNGDVYANLIRLCDNQNSLLIQGAIIGQDTKHGSYSKDQAGQGILDSLVQADMAMVEMHMNTLVLPALARIGLLPEGTAFDFDVNEGVEVLWEKVRDAMNSYDFDVEWLNEKFGLKITGKKEISSPFGLSGEPDSFFV